MWGILDLLNLGTGQGGRQGPRVAGICALILLHPTSPRDVIETKTSHGESFSLSRFVLCTLNLAIILGDFNIREDDTFLNMDFCFLDPFTSVIFSYSHLNYLLAWSYTSPFHHQRPHCLVNLDLCCCSSSTLYQVTAPIH